MMRRFFTLLLTVSALLIAIGFVQSIDAQDQPTSAIKVSPAIIELIAAPGEVSEVTVTVTNIADVPIPIKASPQAFSEIPQNLSDAQRDIFDASRWIELIEADFILDPGESQNVRVAVTVPTDAEPGGHYATVYMRSLIPSEVVPESRLYLTARVGILAFLIVKGDIRENADFPVLRTANVHSHLPVTFETTFRNMGNVHLLPSGVVKIYNWRNQEIEQVQMKPQIVLPGQEFRFLTEWSPSALLGQYTAQVEMRYGSDQTVVLSNRVPLWVSPFMLVIMIVVFGGGFLIILVMYRRRIMLALRILFSGEKDRHNN